jgi:Arc/MetJ family transcription regulator
MEVAMRTNIEIDDALIAEAMTVLGAKTKRATIEKALQDAIRIARQKKAFEAMRGMGWEGNLDEMREMRDFDLGE